MKLVRYGPKGQERPGILDADGAIRDLSDLLDDFAPRAPGPGALQILQAIDVTRLPVVAGPQRFGMPWSGVGKIVAIGLNYHAHAIEANLPVPTEPVMFAKWTSCLNGPNDDVIEPIAATKLDWEVELGIVIGSTAADVSEGDALDYVVPSNTFLIENPGAVLEDANPKAKDFLDFVLSDAGQTEFVKKGFRPVGDLDISDIDVDQTETPDDPFPTPTGKLSTIEELGGWKAVTSEWFGKDGKKLRFDKLYATATGA